MDAFVILTLIIGAFFKCAIHMYAAMSIAADLFHMENTKDGFARRNYYSCSLVYVGKQLGGIPRNGERSDYKHSNPDIWNVSSYLSGDRSSHSKTIVQKKLSATAFCGYLSIFL